MTGKIIVAGSINMDVVTQVTRHPRGGETVMGKSLHYIPGGKGANQAVSASRLSPHGAVLVGKVGQDGFGDSLRAFLNAENLALQHVSVSTTAPTGVAIITVSDDSENTIVVVAGSNGEVSPEDVLAVTLESGDVVVSPFEIPQPTIKAFFEQARKIGAHTVLNPAPAIPFIEGLHDLVDYLIVNETELAFYAHSVYVPETLDGIETMAKGLLSAHNRAVIVTLGAKGALCITHESTFHIAGNPVKAVDTTGAGDCFTGAFAVALSEQKSLQAAILFANQAASLSVQKLGASTSMPYRAELG